MTWKQKKVKKLEFFLKFSIYFYFWQQNPLDQDPESGILIPMKIKTLDPDPH